jgi:hypothetical protein
MCITRPHQGAAFEAESANAARHFGQIASRTASETAGEALLFPIARAWRRRRGLARDTSLQFVRTTAMFNALTQQQNHTRQT